MPWRDQILCYNDIYRSKDMPWNAFVLNTTTSPKGSPTTRPWPRTRRMRSPAAEQHTHDFYEMMYVIRGSGLHLVGLEARPLRAGELAFIRPDDSHTVIAGPREELHFINIAFPALSWRSFCELAQVDAEWPGECPAGRAPTVRLGEEAMPGCEAAFHRALQTFQEHPTGLALCAFFSAVLADLAPAASTEMDLPAPTPAWLSDACSRMREPQNLAAGFPRFVELAGVTPTHLSRSVRSALGSTPTEFIAELRLARAAALLAATSAQIAEIALECGFENLSHFYRLFRRRYGAPPRAFRASRRRPWRRDRAIAANSPARNPSRTDGPAWPKW